MVNELETRLETYVSADFDMPVPSSLQLMHNDRCHSSQHDFLAGLE